MSDYSYLLEMSDDEAEFLDRVFNPQVHGEVRIERDEAANQLTINWFDNYPLSSKLFDIKTHADKAWETSFIRLHKEYVRVTQEAATHSKNADQEVQRLKEQIASLNRKLFGTSSEQSKLKALEPDNPEQDQPIVTQTEIAKIIKLAPKNVGRKPLPAELPRESVTYKLPPEKQLCSCCNGHLHKCDDEIFERISVIPEHYRVIRHVQEKYVCRTCETFTLARAPKSILPGSSYGSPEFLASVAVKRFQYGLPYYRQEQIFNSAGIPFNRTTLANLMIGCADKLTSIYELFKEELRSQPIIHADETAFQVLKEPRRKPESKSYLWLYRSANNSPRPVVLFDYQETREAKHPKGFLSGDSNDSFRGYLCVDGYAGYNKISNILRVGCMAHVRRKFECALKALPSGAEGSYASQALDMIGQLYGIERTISNEPPDKKFIVRQTQSLSILHTIKAWLEDLHPKVLPNSLLGKAINYALAQWYAVSRYVDDGRLAIDNNIAEREIKAFVIGRKNWLFADSADGAETNAVMYSLVQTAKANGLDPYKYLYHVFERMPYMQNSTEVESLLPWNVKITNEESIKLAA